MTRPFWNSALLAVLFAQAATAFATPATVRSSPPSVASLASARVIQQQQQQQYTSTGRSFATDLSLHAIPRGGATAAAATTAKGVLQAVTETPTSLFNTALITLGLTTATIKVWQRQQQLAEQKQQSDGDSAATTKQIPASVKSLQRNFLLVFWLLRCADWLQGPYFYEVYSSKVFQGAKASLGLVSRLFLTGFASTALFGPWVGRAADVYGRKKATLAFTVVYALGAMSTKSPVLLMLFLGRILSGIGTSLLFSAPEAWLVGEAQKNGDAAYLGETFGLVSVCDCSFVCLFVRSFVR